MSKDGFNPTCGITVIINSDKTCIANYTIVSLNVQVRFIGEQGIDWGGPMREYFRLLREETKQWFHGEHECLLPVCNAAAIQVLASYYFNNNDRAQYS